VGIVGLKNLDKRFAALNPQLVAADVMALELRERYSLKFSLSELIRTKRAYGKLPKKALDGPEFRAIAFITKFVRTHSGLQRMGRDRLVGMIRKGLMETLLPLEFELRAAGHFLRRGFDFDFVDMEGRGTFVFFCGGWWNWD